MPSDQETWQEEGTNKGLRPRTATPSLSDEMLVVMVEVGVQIHLPLALAWFPKVTCQVADIRCLDGRMHRSGYTVQPQPVAAAS